MPSTLRPGRDRRKRQNVGTLPAGYRELARELGARAHAELRVDVRQMARHRALGEEERRGDLRVRPAVRDEVGDAPLRRRQALLARAAADRPSSSRARAAQPSAPSSSKPARAASIASRAGRFCRARRRATPSASSARARPNGSPTASCCATASSSSATRLLDVAPRRSDEAAAARDVRQRPVALEAAGSRLPRVEPLDGVVDAPELEQRLDLLGAPPGHGRLALRRRRRRSLRPRRSSATAAFGVAAPELDQRPARERRVEPRGMHVGELGHRGGQLPRADEVAAVRGDERRAGTDSAATPPPRARTGGRGSRDASAYSPASSRWPARSSTSARYQSASAAMRSSRSLQRRYSASSRARARSKSTRPDEDVRRARTRRPAARSPLGGERVGACSASSSAPGSPALKRMSARPAQRRAAEAVVAGCSGSSTAARACSLGGRRARR